MFCPAKSWIARAVPATVVALAGCADGVGEVPDAGFEDGGQDAGLWSGPLAAPALDTLRLAADGSRFLDAAGREVILRGVNAGGRSKFAPYMPFDFRESGMPEQADAPLFDDALEAYLDTVAGWGMNAMRVLFSWQALEPEKGQLDTVYLDRYLAILDAAEARGIRVVVDFHQDVFAEPFCGDGFPLWTLAEPVPEKPEDCDTWFMGYFNNDDVKTAFDRFWQNADGIRDAFEEMWRYMSQAAKQRDCVIGYEIVNEPAAGTADEEAWSTEALTPFYSEMAAIVREAFPEALVFFDASSTSSLAGDSFLTLPSGGDLVFAPHYYDASIYMSDTWGGIDPNGPLLMLRETGDQWGVPTLLGEFGVPFDKGLASEYLRACYDALDAHLMNAMIWELSMSAEDWNNEGFGLLDAQGDERTTAAEAIRPYPAAVGGEIISFGYDSQALSGSLDFIADAHVVTEIAVPAVLYPEGLEVVLSREDARWAFDETAGRLLVETASSGQILVTFGAVE